MNVLRVIFTKTNYWKIGRDDPPSFELKNLAGWSIINPLVYPEFSTSSEHFPIQTRLLAMVGDIEVLVQTDGIILAAPALYTASDFKAEQFTEYLNVFLEHLRHASKQTDIARQVIAMSFETRPTEFSPMPFPIAAQEAESYIKRYIVRTSITWKNVKTADTTLINNNLPVFGTLLLDAILAYMENDYRRAILYAALSAETVATTKLEEAYNRLLQPGDPHETIRLVFFSRKKETIVKDPVYRFLSDRGGFTQLIHELPLYLFRRSLLIENEQLYQKAEKLYRTRNNIAHRGEVATGQETSLFGINDAGAKAAIMCAIGLFKWFGVRDTYIFPTGGFDKVKSIAIPQENADETE